MEHPFFQSLSPFFYFALYVAVAVLGLDKKIGNLPIYLKHYRS